MIGTERVGDAGNGGAGMLVKRDVVVANVPEESIDGVLVYWWPYPHCYTDLLHLLLSLSFSLY